ncbi:hypothetical protein [Edaphobacter modestus]|uniref:Uncharacterized protein n=1 Tax=Edaphobacter modestus TaxID=388466 RepID=A0A4Q7YV35_9BACT|nr:hypothetical protein [Edaphobacter modestus]RZU41498.1 hypothetical protein BDD14_3021 [Edaphobacter modestus]
MANLEGNNPNQRSSVHKDPGTFDDTVRKVGPDVTATLDNSSSKPTEWAGSEALQSPTPGERESPADVDDRKPGLRTIDDADVDDEDDEDEDDDDDDDEDEDDDDEALGDEGGSERIYLALSANRYHLSQQPRRI